MIIIKTEEEIEIMAEAGRIAGLCLKMLGSLVRPGITTKELDKLAEDFIRQHGALPTFKGYAGFPATICASLDNVVVHGIPNNVPLEEGHILSIDVGATYKGFVGDTAATFPVGKVSAQAETLMTVTRDALQVGISTVRPGVRLGDVGFAIETYVKRFGFNVVKDYAGHGVGRRMHEEPTVPNYGIPGRGPVLRKGMVIAIEPMVNIGRSAVVTFPDMRVETEDGKWSAHFEHTVAVTEDGARCLTLV
jgi:methionyl aminopeptidase